MSTPAHPIEFALNWAHISEPANLVIAGGGFVPEYGLTTAIYLSLFLDRRAEESDALPEGEYAFGTSNPRGWWGNELLAAVGDASAGADPNTEYGSRLWLYTRSKLTSRVLLEMRTACEEALDWLLVHGIAKEVAVSVLAAGIGCASIRVTVTRNVETPVQYTFVWDAMEGLRRG